MLEWVDKREVLVVALHCTALVYGNSTWGVKSTVA